VIRVLIVDDDPIKADRVREVIADALPPADTTIAVAKNVHECAVQLTSQQLDLLILDINLPRRADEGPTSDAGVVFLRQLYSSRRYKRPRYIVGLTAYGERIDEYAEEFKQRNWYLVRYNEALDEWKTRLTSVLLHIADAHVFEGKEYRTDIGVITALEEIELEGVLALPCTWKTVNTQGDSTIYHEATWERNGSALNVVAAAALEMGMPASTAVAMKMIQQYRPRYIAMVGIAAGVEGKFGDILIADVAFDYGSGKRKVGARGKSEFAPDPHPIPLDAGLKAKLSYFRRQTHIMEDIRKGAAGGAVPDRLNVQMGPVASGAAVVQDRAIVDEVQTLWRKLVGMEMETYGVFVAARYATDPRPLPLSIKSICDFADKKKNDTYQRYAAYTSARFLFEFSLRLLAVPRQ
jgi:nucleoside phosphorylase